MLEEHQRSATSTPMPVGIVSYSCNRGSVVLYVGQSMSANKSNYHQPLKENKLRPLLCFHGVEMDAVDGDSDSVAQ